MDEAKQKRKRKKSRRMKKPENCSYIIEIQEWNLKYSLSLNTVPNILSGMYLESLNLEINGVIRQPEKYAGKEMTSSFLGDRSIISCISEKENTEIKPNGIGSITLRGEQREFLGVLPFDAIPIIRSLLEAKQIQYLDFYGAVPKHGHAFIESIYFLISYNHENS
jgi:hypothetical protein